MLDLIILGLLTVSIVFMLVGSIIVILVKIWDWITGN